MNNSGIDSDMHTKDSEIEMIVKASEALKQRGLKIIRFPESLEYGFKEYYYLNTLKHVRIALLTGIALFALFGIVDMQLLPDDRNHMWFIRYAIVCPTISVGLAFTYLNKYRRFMQPVLWLVMLTGGLGIVGMVYFDPTPVRNYYYSGILLLIMGAFTFVSFRLYYAIFWAITTLLAYELVANFATNADVNNIVQNTFCIVATVIIGSFSNCLMENYLRRDFLNTILLNHENKKLQRLNLLEQQLLHAQKLESLGVLAGGIAHDFNNILMVIMGNANLAMLNIKEDSLAADNLFRIEQAVTRASDLTKQMLAYSGKGKFVIEDLDLNQHLEKMLPLLEASISKKAILKLNKHQPLKSVEADATQMHQIVMNLVINASEAIGENNGEIDITTGCMDCDQNYLRKALLGAHLCEGGYVFIEVSDTGCGMTEDTIAKLFDPFFSTKFTGRGLGMSAVLGIVKGHKGAIIVNSEIGKGTTFKILLPAISKPMVQKNLDIHNKHEEDWRGRGTVLLVDDEEMVRSLGVSMLEKLGFTPIVAKDGQEAFDIFKQTPDVQFVLLDLTMPRMDGEQCFRELRRLNPFVKVIMASGYNEQEVTQRFVGEGLSGFIQKPYSISELRASIKRIV